MSGSVHIFGTGGHARDVAEIVRALGRRPVFVTPDPTVRDAWSASDAILLEEEAIARGNATFAIGIGDNAVRARVAAAHPDLHFPALVHPAATLANDQADRIAASAGTVVFAGVRIMAGVTIGRFCTFNLNVTVSHDCEIGDFANLSPGANLAGSVRVGRGAWIGIGAAINQGSDARKLEIGDRAVIGSGTVVLGDCTADSVYVGNPARKIR